MRERKRENYLVWKVQFAWRLEYDKNVIKRQEEVFKLKLIAHLHLKLAHK